MTWWTCSTHTATVSILPYSYQIFNAPPRFASLTLVVEGLEPEQMISITPKLPPTQAYRKILLAYSL